MQRRFKCEHTCIDDVAMLQLRKIAMAYCQEFLASPVINLGCHVMYSDMLKRFPNATLNVHESNFVRSGPQRVPKEDGCCGYLTIAMARNQTAYFRESIT